MAADTPSSSSSSDGARASSDKPVAAAGPSDNARPQLVVGQGPPAPSWWQQPWVRRLLVSAGAAAVLASCPYLPWPVAQAVCRALGAGLVQVQQAEAPTQLAGVELDGGVP